MGQFQLEELDQLALLEEDQANGPTSGLPRPTQAGLARRRSGGKVSEHRGPDDVLMFVATFA